MEGLQSQRTGNKIWNGPVLAKGTADACDARMQMYWGENGIHFHTSQFAFKRGRTADISDRRASHRNEREGGGGGGAFQLFQPRTCEYLSKKKKIM